MNRNKREGFIPVILLAVLALVVAVGGVGIGLAWKTDLLDKWLPASVKEFFGKEITTTDGEPTNGGTTDGGTTNGEEDPTKDWKSFSSGNIGFSAKYPGDWKARESTDDAGSSTASFESPDFASEEAGAGEVLQGSYIGVAYLSNPSNKTVGKWSEDWWPASYTLRKEFTVGGYSAILSEGDAYWEGMKVEALVAVGQKVYIFSCVYPRASGEAARKQCTETLELMLSTVAF